MDTPGRPCYELLLFATIWPWQKDARSGVTGIDSAVSNPPFKYISCCGFTSPFLPPSSQPPPPCSCAVVADGIVHDPLCSLRQGSPVSSGYEHGSHGPRLQALSGWAGTVLAVRAGRRPGVCVSCAKLTLGVALGAPPFSWLLERDLILESSYREHMKRKSGSTVLCILQAFTCFFLWIIEKAPKITGA